MKSKEDFKVFVSKNPSFANSVRDGKTSWQKLFELYSLYDEDSKVWDDYLKEEIVTEATSSLSLSGIINSLKGINLDSFQNNLTSIQKAVGFLEELTRKDEKGEEKNKKKPKDEKIDRFYDD